MSEPPLTDDEKTLVRLLRASTRLEDAPAAAVDRAIALFGTRAAAAPKAPGLLQRVLATLTFDSGSASPLAFGMRSSGGAVRQLLFSVDGRDIDLRIAPHDQDASFALTGQVLGPDSNGTVILEGQDGSPRASAPLSDLGEFRLPPVVAGTYRLTLELPDLAIDLPPVQIPQAA